MIKVKAIKDFDLKDFDLLKNIKRASKVKDKKGKLYENDEFECSKEMADYLLGDNPLKKKVVDIIEITPEKKEAEEKPKATTKKQHKKNK